MCDDDRSQAPSVPETDAAISVDDEGTVDPREEQQDIWAQSEGYTPLSDVQYSSLMVSMGPSDGEGNSEDDDSQANLEWRASGGAVFVNSTAISTDGDHEEESHGADEEVARIQISSSIDDFENIAGKALSLLDEEYERTIQCERSPSHGKDEASVYATIPQIAPQEEHQDSRIITATSCDRNQIAMKQGFVPDWDHLERSTNSLKAAHSESPAGNTASVDTDAVRKIVQALSLKADNPFQRKFNEWEQQHPSLPSVHSLIPLSSYKAFRRTTPKAKQATASLSRSATLAEALCRLRDCDLLPLDSETLIIDVVGVDHVECESIERIQATFRPIIRWIGIWKGCSYQHVIVRLVGRELTLRIPSPVDLLTPKAATIFQSAYATCHSGIYHTWLSASNESAAAAAPPPPHVAVAYNSGIWGYTEWQPTIQYLCERADTSIPFVSTAYTLEECQEDFEVIEAAVKGKGRSKVLWDAQVNPFGSKLIRETKSRSSEYRENAAWQAWLLGGGAVDGVET